jgi:hypothetical protein
MMDDQKTVTLNTVLQQVLSHAKIIFTCWTKYGIVMQRSLVSLQRHQQLGTIHVTITVNMHRNDTCRMATCKPMQCSLWHVCCLLA